MSVVLIVVQNLVGIGTTRLLDLHPIVGLLGGSITLVGGHGTGAAYAARLGEAMNLHGIMELTMACATAGLVLGAVLGGPVAEYLLKRYRLTASAPAMSEPAQTSASDAPDDVVTAQSLINTLFVVLLCLAVGKILAGAMAGTGLILPDFVFCLLLGVVIRNAASLTRAFRVSETTVDVVGNVALSLFLVMALMILLVMTVLGCSRGPDATALRAEVQDKLDQRFKPGLSPATLAQVLGATEKGIVGVKSGESRPGDTIKVYGSTTYEWARDRWQSVDAATAGVARVSAPGNAAPPSRSKQLIETLAALVDIPPPGPGPQDEAVISEELDRALRAITARRERRSHVYTIASGPEAGEYHPIADALITRVTSLGETIKIRNLATHGSVENVRLLGAKEADYAFIESNIAAMAAAAEGPFAGQRTATSLRALGSLFPEPVHLVVARASGIRTVADLRGKRVALGRPDSGTRADAVAVLAAHGITATDLAEVRDDSLEAAAARLGAGRLDAVFATIGAPTRDLQRLATRHPIRLISLDVGAIERLVAQNPGLVRLLVPASTYPGQREDVRTIAATALLVTHSDVPEAEAELVLRLVFENPEYLAAGSAQGAKIAKRSGLRGVTIPMHPAASRYFAR